MVMVTRVDENGEEVQVELTSYIDAQDRERLDVADFVTSRMGEVFSHATDAEECARMFTETMNALGKVYDEIGVYEE